MAQNDTHLVWVDMEMSGLDPDKDVVLEVALVVTDKDLNLVEEGPVLVVHQSDAVLDAMDSWNKSTHGKSGLIDKVKASPLSEADVENQMIEFMKLYVGERKSPMCCNSICQDRRFMARHLPKLEAYFHYHNLEGSTLKELAAHWRPELKEGFKKANNHAALADIQESIEELRYYREHFIKMTA